MARKIFLSFHYKADNWRVAQVKSIGKIEGSPLLSANSWEEIKKNGDSAVKSWISTNMNGKTCLVVLIGEKTANRKWVNYEIKKAWKDGLGVVGINIHQLKDSSGDQAQKGNNPFEIFTIGDQKLSNIVKCYNPPYTTSNFAYQYIEENINNWIEEAILIRKKYN